MLTICFTNVKKAAACEGRGFFFVMAVIQSE